MAQIRNGTVMAEQDSPVIKHVYQLTLSSVQNGGSFSVGDEVVYGTTNRGYIVAWNQATSTMKMYRKNLDATDRAPLSTDPLFKFGAPTVNGTVTLQGDSPPNWSTALLGVSGTKSFSVEGTANSASYLVASSTADTLTLSTDWSSGAVTNGSFAITTDFTDNVGLPMIEYGAVNAPLLVTRGFIGIDRHLKFNGALISLTSDSAILAATDTILDFETVSFDTGSFIETAGDGFYTIPEGVSHIRASFSVFALTADADDTLTASLFKGTTAVNGNVTYAGSVIAHGATISATEPLIAHSPVIAVATGDTLLVNVNASAANTIRSHSHTWFAIEAVALTNLAGL